MKPKKAEWESYHITKSFVSRSVMIPSPPKIVTDT